jgi:predicted HicB family RNase H-like nuclease
MKKPKPKERRVAIRVRVKPSVKAMAERLAQKEGRSMADWLERLIAAERARRATKRGPRLGDRRFSE